MHQHSLRTNRIEGAVGEAEGLCVANFEFHGKPLISAPPDCLGDQQFAEVHAGDQAVGADRGGEFEGVGALAQPTSSTLMPGCRRRPSRIKGFQAITPGSLLASSRK